MASADAHDLPFDRKLRRLRRDAASRRMVPGGDWLLSRMRKDLLDRLDLVTRSFVTVLDLGCGDGGLTRMLRARGLDVTPLDAGTVFAQAADGLACDEDRLPFAPGSFDLVVAAGVLDSVNDLPGALTLIRRSLRPDGLFLGVMLGAGSLPRLRQAMLAAGEAQGAAAARIHPQIDVRTAGDLLARAGFAMPVADTEAVAARYPNMIALVRDLRFMAATNVLQARAPLTRSGVAAALADFAQAADPDGKTPERFDVLHLSGWAPAPDQPKAARPGSATVSLAKALGPKAPSSG